MQYGAQVVPFQAEHQHALRYAPDKDFQVVGVVPQAAVPHAFFMKVRCDSSRAVCGGTCTNSS